jgi:Transposase DDE domain
MQIIPRMAAVLQGLLTTTAEEIGTQCHLIKRQREFTASSLLSTFVLGFLLRPKPTWEQLALVARERGANVSAQAVEQRITPALRDSLAQLWQAAVKCVVCSEARVTPLLAKFTHVFIGDSSTISLTDALAGEFPGCGGSYGSGQAALKLQVIWDFLSGRLWRMTCEAGKQNDSTSSVMDETPPAGSLSIFDLGYFSLERFLRWQTAGAHWISRGISDLLVWDGDESRDLHEWLAAQPAGVIDRRIAVGAARLPCRIIALRAPAEVAARRRQKARDKAAKKGRQPTARHLATCDWTVFLTSCPDELLTWKEVVVLYRVRWQIELLFKLWKSHGLIDEHRSTDPVRQLVELYARLIAVIIQHGLILVTCWSDDRVSLTKASRLLRDQLPQLIAVLGDLEQLIKTITRWSQTMPRLTRLSKRKSQPSNSQLLANPELLTYNA